MKGKSASPINYSGFPNMLLRLIVIGDAISIVCGVHIPATGPLQKPAADDVLTIVATGERKDEGWRGM